VSPLSRIAGLAIDRDRPSPAAVPYLVRFEIYSGAQRASCVLLPVLTRR